MKWYLQSGLDSQYILNSGIELKRNIENFPFDLNSLQQFSSIENTIKDNIFDIDDKINYINFNNLSNINKNAYFEKNMIGKNMLDDKMHAIMVNDDEDIIVEINSTDHLIIKVFSDNEQLNRLLSIANEIDDKLSKIFKISYSNKYGYLTQNLQNVGTGLKAEITCFLPGLVLTNSMNKILEALSSLGVKASKQTNYIYTFTNIITLGKSEQEIIQNLKNVVNNIIDQEKLARTKLEKNPIALEDKILRHYGILSNTKSISNSEVQSLLDDVRFGSYLGIIPGLTDLMVNKIEYYSKPNILKQILKQDIQNQDLNVKRAQIIKDIFNNKI